ncbi:MAG: hypothetical protein M3O71_15865 [Bacteroidota bacterium]|nr:hypothetical protein [Bacteroidota bacterium]
MNNYSEGAVFARIMVKDLSNYVRLPEDERQSKKQKEIRRINNAKVIAGV